MTSTTKILIIFLRSEQKKLRWRRRLCEKRRTKKYHDGADRIRFSWNLVVQRHTDPSTHHIYVVFFIFHSEVAKKQNPPSCRKFLLRCCISQISIAFLKIVTVYTHTYSNVCGCVHIYSEFNTHTATHIILTKSNSERFETIQCVQPQRAVKGKRHDKDACRYINDTFSDLRYRDESQEQETKRTNKLARAHKRVREAH